MYHMITNHLIDPYGMAPYMEVYMALFTMAIEGLDPNFFYYLLLNIDGSDY